MKITGKCHCGKITFQSEVDAQSAIICHCTDCQTLTGTAYRVSVPTKRDDFKLLSGQPKTYVKTAEDGTKSNQTFCADCGSPIYSAHENATSYKIRLGAIEQRRELRPSSQIWLRSKLPWSSNLEGLPGTERD